IINVIGADMNKAGAPARAYFSNGSRSLNVRSACFIGMRFAIIDIRQRGCDDAGIEIERFEPVTDEIGLRKVERSAIQGDNGIPTKAEMTRHRGAQSSAAADDNESDPTHPVDGARTR